MKFSIPLDQVTVASPCKVPWDTMVGDDRVRYCDQCAQRVYNLSEMTAAEAQSFVAQPSDRMCIRFYRRFDGTMMTKDCPVGLRAFRRRVAMFAAGIIAVVFTGIGLGAFVLRGNRAGPFAPEEVVGTRCVPAHIPRPAEPAAPQGVAPPGVNN
jgi:hypothetical protein